MSDRLSDKVAIVTGAAGGIGSAITRLFASEGGRVVLADLDTEAMHTLAQGLAGGADRHLVVECDVTNEPAVEACARSAVSRFGKLDIIVNNAGLLRFKSLADWTAEEWTQIFRVDLIGAALFTREAFRLMSDGGAIINISSVHAIATTPGVAPYAAAKAALLSLTRSVAVEGRERRIRCNAIVPGAIDTPMLWDNPNVRAGVERIETADVGTPEDVANATLFLAADDSRFISGATVVVDGGRLVRL